MYFSIYKNKNKLRRKGKEEKKIQRYNRSNDEKIRKRKRTSEKD